MKQYSCLVSAARDDDNRNALGHLAQAIVDNTKGDLFWIGEFLLVELEKETGYKYTPSNR